MKHSGNVNTVNAQSGFVCFVEANVVMSTDDFAICAAGNSKHGIRALWVLYWILPPWKF